jgi:N-acetylmuramoyl-L-alanine amidase
MGIGARCGTEKTDAMVACGACRPPRHPRRPLAIHDWPLAYANLLDSRATRSIDLVVIHCTELPDLAMARTYGERLLYAGGTGNSGHYYVDRDGSVASMFVRPDRVAHHTRGCNPRSASASSWSTPGATRTGSIRAGRSMAEPYTQAQIDALVALLRVLTREIPTLTRIAGHEDLDLDEVEASDDATLRVKRKLDPGPRFPWPRVLDATRLHREFRQPPSTPASDP